VKVIFRQSFVRDLKKIKDKAVLNQVKEPLEQVEAAQQLGEIKSLAKLSGSTDYYRIRVGEYIVLQPVLWTWLRHKISFELRQSIDRRSPPLMADID